MKIYLKPPPRICVPHMLFFWHVLLYLHLQVPTTNVAEKPDNERNNLEAHVFLGGQA